MRNYQSGDGISQRLERHAAETRAIMEAFRSGRVKGVAARRSLKRMEWLSRDAGLLWKVRLRMLEISPLRPAREVARLN